MVTMYDLALYKKMITKKLICFFYLTLCDLFPYEGTADVSSFIPYLLHNLRLIPKLVCLL